MGAFGVETISLATSAREVLVDITPEVQRIVTESGLEDGLVVVYCPHTTGAITVNEGADPDVRSDMLRFLSHLVPRDWGFDHVEGNSDAHVKSSLVGASETFVVEGGRLRLGTWQKVYFCEFDGPRRRRVLVKLLAS